MSVTFYTMVRCGFCNKAKEMFKDEIASGEMVVKPSSEAPAGTRGFPTFTANGKSHSGLPSSKEELYSKLGVSKENYKSSDMGFSKGNYKAPPKNSRDNIPMPFWGVY